MAINKTKANNAMEIAEGFAEITRLRQNIDVKLRKLQEKIEAEGQPGLTGEDILALRRAHEQACRRDFIDHQSTWHNIAYERGYYDTEPKARKLSKTDPYKK